MTIQELEAKVKELNLELERIKEEKRKLWRAEYDEKYYCIRPTGAIDTGYEFGNVSNKYHHEFGNYYRTKELAEQDAKEQRLRNRVRQLRDMLCEGYKFNQRTFNYSIYYNKDEKYFAFYERYVFCIGEVYFDNIEHVKQACDILNNEFDEEYMEDFFNGN
jgi:hypothetical protein